MSVIIISVGTSLITNLPIDQEDCIDFYPGGFNPIRFIADYRRNQTEAEKRLVFGGKTLEDYILDSFGTEEAVIKQLKQRTSQALSNDTDKLPAELSSLLLWYYEFKEEALSPRSGKTTSDDHLYLICSDTQESKYCAKIIKALISKIKAIYQLLPENIDITSIECLNVENPTTWKQGLAKLFTVIQAIKAKYSGNITIIRTGGYKELSSELHFIAQDPNINATSFYIFENTLHGVESKSADQTDYGNRLNYYSNRVNNYIIR